MSCIGLGLCSDRRRKLRTDGTRHFGIFVKPSGRNAPNERKGMIEGLLLSVCLHTTRHSGNFECVYLTSAE